MPEGRTSTYNPATGERQETTFQYTSPEKLQGIEAMDTKAVNEYLRQIQDAEKALDAAYKFQGLRALDRAVKEAQQRNESVTNAYARFGPGAFASRPQAFGPAMKAITPPAPRPMNALDTARMNELNRRGLPQDLSLQKPVISELEPGVRAVQVPGSKGWQLIKDQKPTVTETVRTELNKNHIVPPGQTNAPAYLSSTNLTTRGKQAAPAKLSEQVAQTAPTEQPKVNEVIRKTKDGKRAVFNADTKEFLRYAD